MTAPDWLATLLAAAPKVAVHELTRLPPPAEGVRRSAVLVLFGVGEHGPDVLLIERAHDMRSHAGQPAFPGGALDPADDGPVAAALREANEETGLDPAGVEVLASLPELWVPPSGHAVTPVLGWWQAPSPVSALDPAEVASVHRVPLTELTDPANRFLVHHPSGYEGPAFGVRGLVVWGFTGGLLDRLIYLGGWERPWDRTRVDPVSDVRPPPVVVPDPVQGTEPDR